MFSLQSYTPDQIIMNLQYDLRQTTVKMHYCQSINDIKRVGIESR